MKVFLEEINILVNRLGRENSPSLLWLGIIQSVEGLKRMKKQRMGEFELGIKSLLEFYPSSTVVCKCQS